MSKINKYANLYDKDGNLIKRAILDDYTIEETEKLVDELTELHKESPEDQSLTTRLNNAMMWLYGLYQRYGNPHEKELIEAIKKAANKDVSEQQVTEALEALKETITSEETPTYNVNTTDDEYIEPLPESEGNTDEQNLVDS